MKEIIYGKNPVSEWLEAGLEISRIFLMKGNIHNSVVPFVKKAEQQKIMIKYVSRQELARLAGTENHQQIAAEVNVPDYWHLDELLAKLKDEKQAPLLALLDGVQDPHNLGAILRSADGAGVQGIIIPKDKAVGLKPSVVKASAGAAAYVPVVQVVNLSRTIDDLKKESFWFFGTDQDAEMDYTTADYKGKSVIVLGSEGKGMRRIVREKCDFLVSIPMAGKVNSLNVSVSAALLFFEAKKQR